MPGVTMHSFAVQLISVRHRHRMYTTTTSCIPIPVGERHLQIHEYDRRYECEGSRVERGVERGQSSQDGGEGGGGPSDANRNKRCGYLKVSFVHDHITTAETISFFQSSDQTRLHPKRCVAAPVGWGRSPRCRCLVLSELPRHVEEPVDGSDQVASTALQRR